MATPNANLPSRVDVIDAPITAEGNVACLVGRVVAIFASEVTVVRAPLTGSNINKLLVVVINP